MYDREIRWSVLVPVSILLGFAALAAEMAGLYWDFPARPDLFWSLAFFTGLRAAPVECLAGFAWCGLVRDLLLGPKAGAAMLAYILAAWLLSSWRPLLATRTWLGRTVAAGVSVFPAALLKHALDAGGLAPELWERIVAVSIGDAAATVLFHIPFALVLSLPSLRPWRERNEAYYGII